jgi:hypothetical protein
MRARVGSACWVGQPDLTLGAEPDCAWSQSKRGDSPLQCKTLYWSVATRDSISLVIQSLYNLQARSCRGI